MSRSESIDIARAHACAMRDLSETVIAKIDSGKHDEVLNLLILARQRGVQIAAAIADVLPKAVLAVRDPSKWAYLGQDERRKIRNAKR